MRFSVIICNYNYARFVDRAIRSALDQDHPDREVVVVDDGSCDESRQVIDAWKDRIVTVFKDNGGQVSAYNAGFAASTGDVVLFLDADDFLEPHALSAIARAFAPGVVKVHYPMRVVDEAGQPLGPVIPSRLDAGDVSDRLRRGVLYASAPGSGNAYHRAALSRLMPILENTVDRHGADLYTIYGISLLGAIAVAGEQPLASYRLHASDTSQVAFGNAAQAQSREPESSYRRYRHMRAWLRERLGSEMSIPSRLRDFSLEKQGYARALLDSDHYAQRVWRGLPYLLRRLLPAIGARPAPRERILLTGWGVAVLFLPRPIAFPLTRYVCNPASR